MTRYCKKRNHMVDEKEFYRSNNLEKYPDNGFMDICKSCLTLNIDNWDPETFLPILEELDIPYVPRVWRRVLERFGQDPKKVTGTTILGRYISQMKLKQYKTDRWADTERIQQEEREKDRNSLRAGGYSEEEIEEMLKEAETLPPKPQAAIAMEELNKSKSKSKSKDSELDSSSNSMFSFVAEYEKEDADLAMQLTSEDKQMLKLKWGPQYRLYEQVKMEQLYNDMMHSYDIQTAAHKDTLILICKASLKANQLMDSGDIEGAQKIIRTYDALMKSGKFTAAQNKEEQGEYVDAIGSLVAVCEARGFIPRYYTDGPQDKVDQTLLDMQHYTRTLVTEEMNLGEMIESSMKEILKDKAREAQTNTDDTEEDPDEAFDKEVLQYDTNPEITDEDFKQFYEKEDSFYEQDMRNEVE